MLCLDPVGGESTKAAAFRAFWEAGAPLVGDEGAKGWAAWESSQGLTFESPANAGGAPSDHVTSTEGATARHEEEEKGGWGEWVPLMPETPLEPKPAPAADADEAAAAADQVSLQMCCLTTFTGSDAVHYSDWSCWLVKPCKTVLLSLPP